MDILTISFIAWGIQALGFGLIGDTRTCGLGRAFLAAALAGPFVAMTLIIVSKEKPPMPG